MPEFEIKLEIPPERVKAVQSAVRKAPVQAQQLRAIYFDTPDQALRRHRLVLRLRKEDGRWVQAAKGTGERPLERLEHEFPVPWPADEETAPPLDLARHDGTPVGDRLMRALRQSGGPDAAALLPQFETSVQRLTRIQEAGRSRVEIALDRGRVIAGGRSRELCEVEFELKEGDSPDAVGLARAWCAEHGLYVGTASKAEKGMRLAEGHLFGPAVSAPDFDLPAHADSDDVVRCVLGSCLEQVLGNATEIAGGSSDPDHIHQLRVGIRRLRTASREIGSRLGRDMGGQWEQALVDVFRELGRHRDYHHVTRGIEPRIEQEGGPPVDVRPLGENVPDPGAAVRSPAFQDALLGLVGLAHGAPSPDDAKARKPRKQLRRTLAKLHAQCVRDGRKFARLDPTRQHRVRKRLKRLRYLSEFLAPLFGRRRTRAFIEALKPVQDALGQYNDELMALEMYRGLAASDPRALFGVGWLSARAQPNADSCAGTLRGFSKVRPFWD